MAQINLLEQETIDKIAAGEVVERPASIVKELVENSIDAGATAITVEIKEGGISLIRVTDNGSGIHRNQIAKAFLRHATSKIKSAKDLSYISSLGFRGEALSSIAAISQVELISKVAEDLTGIQYIIEGGKEISLEEIGAPDGTTFIVKNIFYNTPVRKKFLKQPQTEAGYISSLMEYMSLSHADISFKFVVNGQIRFHTSGNKDVKEIIYRIYGKDTTEMLVPIQTATPSGDIALSGYLAKPECSRANRSFEIYFINGRYIKSTMIAKALEEGYKPYLMQHKFPFLVLHININSELIDVNVHPTKMEVRFTNEALIVDFLENAIRERLHQLIMIPDVQLVKEEVQKEKIVNIPEPFENKRLEHMGISHVAQNTEYHTVDTPAFQENTGEQLQHMNAGKIVGNKNEPKYPQNDGKLSNVIKASEHIIIEKPAQMNFFEYAELFGTGTQSLKAIAEEYEVLGQLFKTYWLLTFEDKMLIVDQHAAHEKVKFEEFMKQLEEKKIESQMLNPPIIITLSSKEENTLRDYMDYFTRMGFEIEDFGDSSYALRSVPTNLYGCREQELFIEILDELADMKRTGSPDVITRRIATMSCKAAVKGNTIMNETELKALMNDLMKLENPYQCPHGRPTIISMSKYEIEKKFKRIL